MKMNLPIRKFIVFSSLFVVFIMLPTLNFTSAIVHAVGPPPPPSSVDYSSDPWIEDRDVNFAGKIAVRSQDVLNWVVKNYEWSNVQPGQTSTPFDVIWVTIRNIVYIFLLLFILVAAFLIIITRGKSLTVKKFLPRFILVVVLVTFSFSLISTIYWGADQIQGFFFRKPGGNLIQAQDLLSVAFKYGEFLGLRLQGNKYDESVFISTLLTKLTAATYFAMFGILIVRKVILWFFIVISPIFPLLLMFAPLRNSAKIWAGEFFRWLLYAPLFAILLSGLVAMWKIAIPLNLFNDTAKVQCGAAVDPIPIIDKYPTSIDILLAGPCINATFTDSIATNSLNSPQTFIEYVVALIMLWMVIIIPFLLLKIFLDYFNKFSLGESNVVKYLAQTSSPLLNRYGFNGGGGGVRPPPGGPAPSSHTGLAKSLPVTFSHSSIQQSVSEAAESAMEQNMALNQAATENTASTINESVTNAISSAASSNQSSQQSSAEHFGTAAATTFGQNLASTNIDIGAVQVPEITAQILNLTNLNIPTMKDISRFESAMVSGTHDTHTKDEMNKVYEALNRISGTSSITSPSERSHYSEVREKIVTQAKSGNSVANSILSASVGGGSSPIPEVNKTQQVSLEDYEEVKKIWEENYGKMDVPPGPDGKPRDRKEWLQEEVKNIPTVIDYLMSGDPALQQKGKDMVSKILPFLLLGGFSKAEIVAYLKAKLQAAKNTLTALGQKQEDQDTMVDVEKKEEAKPKTMEAEAEIPNSEQGKVSNEQSATGIALQDPSNPASTLEPKKPEEIK